MYLSLFLAFFRVGLFSFGGGLAALPLIQQEIVEINNWISLNEFTDLISIAQMTPGPIAINSATFVGLKLGGVLGATAATVGCVLPGILMVYILLFIYNRYKEFDLMQSILKSLRPAVVALIASAGINIMRLVVFKDTRYAWSNLNWIGIIIFVLSFVALRKFKLNPVIVMLISGIIGGAIYLLV